MQSHRIVLGSAMVLALASLLVFFQQALSGTWTRMLPSPYGARGLHREAPRLCIR